MKASWMLGIVFIYLIIFAAEMLISGGSIFNVNNPNNDNTRPNLGVLAGYDVEGGTNVGSNFTTIVKNLGSWFTTLGKLIVLYEPSVFAGNYLWVWVFLCLPIDIAMAFTILSILRGVSSS